MNDFFLWVQNAFNTIIDFFNDLINETIALIDLVNSMIGSAISYLSWLPDEIIAILVIGLGVAILFKVLGREG